MKNKLFFSSFILTTMLFNIMNSAIANEQLSSDEMTFSIPSMVAIINNNSTLSSSATATSESKITLNSPLTATFDVSTTESSGIDIKIDATAPVNSNSRVSAMSQGHIIVFTKSDGSASASAVLDARYYSPTAQDNPNAIAFSFLINNHDYDFSNSIIANYVDQDGERSEGTGGVYFHVNGSKTLTCQISGDSEIGTFAMNDEPGNYTATLTVTQIVGHVAWD